MDGVEKREEEGRPGQKEEKSIILNSLLMLLQENGKISLCKIFYVKINVHNVFLKGKKFT